VQPKYSTRFRSGSFFMFRSDCSAADFDEVFYRRLFSPIKEFIGIREELVEIQEELAQCFDDDNISPPTKSTNMHSQAEKKTKRKKIETGLMGLSRVELPF